MVRDGILNLQGKVRSGKTWLIRNVKNCHTVHLFPVGQNFQFFQKLLPIQETIKGSLELESKTDSDLEWLIKRKGIESR